MNDCNRRSETESQYDGQNITGYEECMNSVECKLTLDSFTQKCSVPENGRGRPSKKCNVPDYPDVYCQILLSKLSERIVKRLEQEGCSCVANENRKSCEKSVNTLFLNPCMAKTKRPTSNSRMESQCKEYYDDCLSQENARTCGIPLLNISVSCAIETDTGSCDKDACITSVGNFFFGNDHDFTHTRRLFECCEHEDSCAGFPDHIYAPWKCLGKDPFYSCSRVYDECTNYTEDQSCKFSYETVISECPSSMFDEDTSTCEPEINDSCFKHTRQLEGWYCSCRYNHDDVGDDPNKRTNMTEEELKQCNMYKKIFTHNSCIDKANIRRDLEEYQGASDYDNTMPIVVGIILGVCLVITFVYFSYIKLRGVSSPRVLRLGSQGSSHQPSNETIISSVSQETPKKSQIHADRPPEYEKALLDH